jgi:hypothetical protein
MRGWPRGKPEFVPPSLFVNSIASYSSCEGEIVKNPVEILRRKEAELARLQEEVDALRLVGKLLREQAISGKNEPPSRGKVLQMP